MKRLARHRDFRLLFAGHVASLFGDRALFVVLGISALVTLVDFRLLSAGAAVGFVCASLYLTRAPVLRESARTRAAVPADSA